MYMYIVYHSILLNFLVYILYQTSLPIVGHFLAAYSNKVPAVRLAKLCSTSSSVKKP